MARRWLDEQFVANECEPLRATGKVLTVDKLLAIAASVGRRRFDDDESFRFAYANAAIAAMFDKLDVDHDGQLTLAEFAVGYYSAP